MVHMDRSVKKWTISKPFAAAPVRAFVGYDRIAFQVVVKEVRGKRGGRVFNFGRMRVDRAPLAPWGSIDRPRLTLAQR